jgi:hypothetical protein
MVRRMTQHLEPLSGRTLLAAPAYTPLSAEIAQVDNHRHLV